MAIDYNSGISSLNVGAPDIKYTGDQGPRSPQEQQMASADPMLVEEYKKYVFEMQEQGQTPISFREFVQQVMSGMAQGGRAGQAYGGTAHPTYTQSRKQRMAYGGIAGLDGRRQYGIGSWIQKAKDKVVGTVKKVIPKELKNPAVLATLTGLGLNQFGVPFTGTPGDRMGQNWLGDLVNRNLVIGEGFGGAQTGDTGFNLLDPKTYLGGSGGSGGPGYKAPTGAMGDVWNMPTGIPKAAGPMDYLQPGWELAQRAKDLPFLGDVGGSMDYMTGDKSLLERGTDWVKDQFGRVVNKVTGETDTGTGTGQDIAWKRPLAIGAAAGAAQAAMPQAQLPQDTSGIDIANIRSRAKTGSDPGLHFLPQASATTAYAQGGRIGYQDAGEVDELKGLRDPFVPGRLDREGEGFYQDEFTGMRDPFVLQDELEGLRDPFVPGRLDREGEGFYQDEFTGMRDPFAPLEPTAVSGIEGQQAKLKGLALAQYRILQKKQAMEQYGGEKMTPQDKKFLDKLKKMMKEEKMYSMPILTAAQGGRIGAQEGGLMNLGGMEKDYRQEGGFVPLGGEERADDVPARLSKNEFVFTADAVRSAGGGDIDAGAEVMENVMNNLEQGGQISEGSQGLEGARDMFATAQRLEGVM